MLGEQVKYIAPYDWLIYKNIQEWDLEKANISVLREDNIISEEQYNQLYNLPKKDREITVGYMRKNPEISKAVNDGIMRARIQFLTTNNIQDENILYIDNDSITIFNDFKENYINGRLSKYINFRVKNTYTSFYRLIGNIDFLYFTNGIMESFRFKGINQDKIINYHKGFFLDFLLSVAYSGQTDSLINTLDIIRNTYSEYVNKRLDYRFYREFNSNNKFHIINTEFHQYYTDFIDPSNINLLDINYNACIVQTLYKIFMTDYFKQKR